MEDVRIISGRRRYYGRERSQQARKRHGRRRALHELVGTTCRCGAPATDLVDPSAPLRGGPRSDLHRGPADRGLSSRAELILASAARRVAMCHPCQVSSMAGGRAPGARDGLRPPGGAPSPALGQGEATAGHAGLPARRAS